MSAQIIEYEDGTEVEINFPFYMMQILDENSIQYWAFLDLNKVEIITVLFEEENENKEGSATITYTLDESPISENYEPEFFEGNISTCKIKYKNYRRAKSAYIEVQKIINKHIILHGSQ